MGKFANRVEGRALPGAFQYADIVSVQVGHLREFLLRNTLGEPKLPQALAMFIIQEGICFLHGVAGRI